MYVECFYSNHENYCPKKKNHENYRIENFIPLLIRKSVSSYSCKMLFIFLNYGNGLNDGILSCRGDGRNG